MKSLARMILAASTMFVAPIAGASESDFLQSLEGTWRGSGTVKVRTDASPVKVACKFTSQAADASLALDGNCRGLIVVSRTVEANLTAQGGSYSGSYVGAGTGTAALSGSRRGNAIDLGIRWAKKVNGDRNAVLTVEKVGADGMTLTTVDVDPKTGKNVVTSRIILSRV
ncbi:hypothetical protein [Aminobacter carboxidus]|uniref:Uncharacterized protein n=1 Tax=Aminobacter carboxidus TaxID=376165 RepID=A0ABR9GQU9_9HYPH|nr:hypothetical protein [Aminobacter carboxidus]MBE1205958.1 hypothetical protein [Aminobacter carboxidus]